MKKYPFSPELLDALPEALAAQYRKLEETLLEEICSRLKLAGQLNEVTVQAIRALRSHGIDLRAIEQAVAETAGISERDLDALLTDVVLRNQQYYTQLLTLADVTQPEQLVDAAAVEAIRAQTMSTFRNLTASMGFLVNAGRTVLPPSQAYQWALDQAVFQIQTGAVSYDRAIQSAVKQLASSGLKVVNYASGHADQIDVAARRAVMTGISQICAQYTEQSAAYLDTPYFEISAHVGARDKPGPSPWSSHKAWQGRVYSTRSGDIYPNIYETCGLGYVDGLEGANCRHRRFPWIEGVSERTYTDAQLAHIDDGKGGTFDGVTYTAYEATQMQRKLERTIRKVRREKKAYQAAGLTDDATASGIRLRRLNEKYTGFCQAADLPTQKERLKVLYVDENTLNAKAKSGIIKTDIGRSISARNTMAGKPNAITILGANLNKRQEALLSKLQACNSHIYIRKCDVSMKDLSALTARTGDEFAMFTKGGYRLVVRGNSTSVRIGVEEALRLAALGYRWSGHTHPGSGELTKMASRGDVEVLKAFGQAKSVIYDSVGRHEIFRR